MCNNCLVWIRINDHDWLTSSAYTNPSNAYILLILSRRDVVAVFGVSVLNSMEAGFAITSEKKKAVA